MSLRGLTLRNRVVVAPMHQYAAISGFPTDWHLMNAGRYAAGGVGLVMMESTKVERRGCGTVGDLGLWDDAFVPHFKRIVDFIHGCGTKAGIQLGHSGRKARTSRPWEGGKPLTEAGFAELSAASGVANDWDAWELVAPSSLPADANAPVPRALTTAEVGEVAQSFGRAAARARAAGFDTVEIHGAHGFLVHEFLSPQANQRTDQYGGSPANRRRFAIEVAESVRANWPVDLPVFMRLSVDDDAGWSPADSVVLARELKAVGVDVIDCSAGGILARPVSSTPIGYGYQVPFAQTLREQAGIQTMAVGLIVHHEHAEAILQEGRADLIAIGREMLYNPNWALDAARKMGVDVDFSIIPPAGGWWLQKRAAAMPGLLTSTQPAPPLKA
jgi:2,4-dienoyl-CoA reductase-like NADH-dependent reductase (Old Yellow Enzyme family)